MALEPSPTPISKWAFLQHFAVNSLASGLSGLVVFSTCIMLEGLDFHVHFFWYLPYLVWSAFINGRAMTSIRRSELQNPPVGPSEVPTPMLGLVHGMISVLSGFLGYWIALRVNECL